MDAEKTYGEATLEKLNELLADGVSSAFWVWRKENKNRASVLNKAGLVLFKNENGSWGFDAKEVTALSLDEARREVLETKAFFKTYVPYCEQLHEN